MDLLLTNTVADAVRHLDQPEVRTEYTTLLDLLRQKFGAGSTLVLAITSLEKMPASLARKAVLREELAAHQAQLDGEILIATRTLLRCLPGGNQNGGAQNPQQLVPAPHPGPDLLRKLDFGMESAETDMTFLEKAFLYTAVFDRIKTGKKHLVLGRKGAGKTAVCIKLYDYLDSLGAQVSLISPRDLQKFKMSMLEKGSLNSSESTLLAWKYVFLVQISEYLLEDAKSLYGHNSLSWPEPLRQVRRFLVNYEGEKTGWLQNTFKIISRIRNIGVKLPVAEISVETQPDETQDFDNKLDDITDAIRLALRRVNMEPAYLLVDKVDEIWDPTPESKELIIGLLRAMKEILEELQSVHTIVFLRSDIYESLEFHDSDKFHSMEEHVWWSKQDLKEMLALRMKLSTGLLYAKPQTLQPGPPQQTQHAGPDTNVIWQSLFPSQIEHKDSFEYLLQYTFMRPRDLIQLCNLCRDRAQDRRHDRITEADIQDALPKYSQWKLQDLRDEYRIQYPFLEILFTSVFYNTSSRLDRAAIKQSFERVRERLVRNFGDYYFNPLDNLLQVLYSIGFLGVLDQGAVRYAFLGHKAFIAYVSQFEIHPMFRWALGIETSKVGQPAFPPIPATPGYAPQAQPSGQGWGQPQQGNPSWQGWGQPQPTQSQYGQKDNTNSPGEYATIVGNIRQSPDYSTPPLSSDMDKLRMAMLRVYTRTDFEILTAKLNVKYDVLGGVTLEQKIIELIQYCQRRGKYQDLVRRVLKDHPKLAREIQ